MRGSTSASHPRVIPLTAPCYRHDYAYLESEMRKPMRRFPPSSIPGVREGAIPCRFRIHLLAKFCVPLPSTN